MTETRSEPNLEELLERETQRIAKQYGCDRAVFTVCWAEHEGTGQCVCKEEARALIQTPKAHQDRETR